MSGLLRLRVLTFNIHGGRPATGPVDLQAVAEVLRRLQPDLAALQEVHCYFPSFQNQPQQLRRLLGREVHFGCAMGLGPVGYGNAILSAPPVERLRSIPLPLTRQRRGLEPRGLMEAQVSIQGRTVRFFNTHLGLTPEQRRRQLRQIANRIHSVEGPVILAGDLNAAAGSDELRPLAEAGLVDCAGEAQLTFPAVAPRCRIDHLFVSRHFQVERCFAEETGVSDHRPLIADLVLRD